jgi:RND superfamily putative drug exporter
MVAVFSIFATLSEIEFKVFGVAMAVAVLIDATVVRGVLLPAGLALLGDRAWAMPGRHRVRGQSRPLEVEPGTVRENQNLTLDDISRGLG